MHVLEENRWIIHIFMFWALLIMLNYLCKTYFQRIYHWLTVEKGITIFTGRIQWYTRVFNSTFSSLARIKPHLLDKWFDVGVIISLVCGILSIGFLMAIPINTLFRSQKAEDQILKPVIPGVNLPKSDIGYYIVTLFLSAVLHEVGHAVAACRENVKVNGFGVFLLFIYPGAFVDMHSETLFAVTPWKQLRIFCAGVWHNIVISVVGLGILFSLPYIVRPFYSVNEHLVVVSHTENSVVSGSTGLFSGDVITHVDNCKVNSVSDWIKCLSASLQANHSSAYKLPKHVRDNLNLPVSVTNNDCVCEDNEAHICYQVLNGDESLPDGKPVIACLRAREIITNDMCTEQLDGCVIPYTNHIGNHTKLLVLKRASSPPVIFFGHPVELHKSVILGEVLPKQAYMPFMLPYAVENLSKYFISLSGALATLNIVPCYALDGQYISKALIDILLVKMHPENRELVFTLVLLSGSFVLFVNVFLAMYWLLF